MQSPHHQKSNVDKPLPHRTWAQCARAPLDETALGPAQIAAMADAGVARAVKYAWDRSPFYRARFEALRLRPGQVKTAADLERVPPTTKRDLSTDTPSFWCVPQDRVVDIVTTSGTTGVPVVIPMTASDVLRLGYNERLSFTCAGLTDKDVAILAVTMDKCFIAGLAYYQGLTMLGAATVRVGSGSPLMLLALLEKLQATAIVSVPSFLKRVAESAVDRGFDLAGAGVRRLVCIGETIRDSKLTPNALGASISSSWGARAYATYAATEFASSFCECEAGLGGHMHPELLHVEILDDDGRPAPDGVAGEITVTTFGVEALPLIRFRTGDCARLTRERCACGRWTPRLGPIIGRRNQMMKLKGTTVYPAGVQNVLDSMPHVTDYVMIVTSAGALSDELEVLIAVRGNADDAVRTIRESLQAALRVTPSVRVAPENEIARIQESETYRKKRVFIDRRTTDDAR